MIAVVSATPQEVWHIRRALARRGVRLVVTGAGRSPAESGARRALDSGVRCLVQVGFSGALHPALKRGDVVVSSDLSAGDGLAPLVCDPHLVDIALKVASREGIKAWVGTALVAPALVSTPEAKRELGASSGALAVDLESYWACRVAQEMGLPFVSIRVVLDAVEDGLPPFVSAYLAGEGWRRVPRVALALLRRPWSVVEAASLARRTLNCSRVLARVVEGLVSAVTSSEDTAGEVASAVER